MAQEFSTVDALIQQVAHVQLAIEAQRVGRAGVEAMIAEGGKEISASVFLGAYATVLAHGVRVLVVCTGTTWDEALAAILGAARVALVGGIAPWTDPEGGLR